MDELTYSLLTGILANALTSLGKAALEEGAILGNSEDLRADEALDDILRDALGAVEECSDAAGLERISALVQSPEVFTTLRGLYAVRLEPSPATLSDLKLQFRAHYKSFAASPESPELDDASDALFEQLLRAVDRMVELAMNSGSLVAHDMRSAGRAALLLDELAAARSSLDMLNRPALPSPDEINAFEVVARAEMADANARIRPPNIDGVRMVHVDDLYVAPDITASRTDEERSQLAHLLRDERRVVILGDPGGGKTTLAKKLCHDLGSGRPVLAGGAPIPFLVILRDFGSPGGQEQQSIVEFIEKGLRTRHQLSVPLGAVEYLLLNSRAAVIFDGLDELLETAARTDVTLALEAFVRRYPMAPVVVTSRSVGYDQAPLNPEMFVAARLAPFSARQVLDYAHKWFALDASFEDREQGVAQAFLNESATVADLRQNPLLLSLMCNVYRGEGYIPRNRADVYEKCAVMLFERWDRSRGIGAPLPFQAHVTPAMKYLAHWILDDEKRQSGVSRTVLVTEVAGYLASRAFEDRDESRYAAEAFVDFCTGRAWVFTDTGTTDQGEPLFQFTHRTFLEYFAAGHLVRVHSDARRLTDALLPRIERREWDMVAQLAFYLQEKNEEGASDVIVTVSLSAGLPREENVVAFLVRALEFLSPSPAAIRAVCVAAMRFCVRRETDAPHAGALIDGEVVSSADLGGRGFLAREILEALGRVAPDNERTARTAVMEELVETIKGCDARLAGRAGEIALGHLIGRDDGGPSNWATLAGDAWEHCGEQIQALSATVRHFAIRGYWRNSVTVSEFIAWYGVKGFLSGVNFEVVENTRLVAAGAAPAAWFLGYDPGLGESKDWEGDLAVLGGLLPQEPMPWIDESDALFVGVIGKDDESVGGVGRGLKGRAGLGGLLLSALQVEIENRRQRRPRGDARGLRLEQRLARLRNGMLEKRERVEEIAELSQEFDLDSPARGLLDAWAAGQVNFAHDGKHERGA